MKETSIDFGPGQPGKAWPDGSGSSLTCRALARDVAKAMLEALLDTGERDRSEWEAFQSVQQDNARLRQDYDRRGQQMQAMAEERDAYAESLRAVQKENTKLDRMWNEVVDDRNRAHKVLREVADLVDAPEGFYFDDLLGRVRELVEDRADADRAYTHDAKLRAKLDRLQAAVREARGRGTRYLEAFQTPWGLWENICAALERR